MAGRKTSAEKARDDAENAAADDMFGGAFGGLDNMEVPETPPVEEVVSEEGKVLGVSALNGEYFDLESHL